MCSSCCGTLLNLYWCDEVITITFFSYIKATLSALHFRVNHRFCICVAAVLIASIQTEKSDRQPWCLPHQRWPLQDFRQYAMHTLVLFLSFCNTKRQWRTHNTRKCQFFPFWTMRVTQTEFFSSVVQSAENASNVRLKLWSVVIIIDRIIDTYIQEVWANIDS